MAFKALHDPTFASLLFCPLHPTLGSSLHPLLSDTHTLLKPFINTRRWFSPALSLSLNAFSYLFIGNNNDWKLQDLNVSQPLITVENKKVFLAADHKREKDSMRGKSDLRQTGWQGWLLGYLILSFITYPNYKTMYVLLETFKHYDIKVQGEEIS